MELRVLINGSRQFKDYKLLEFCYEGILFPILKRGIKYY